MRSINIFAISNGVGITRDIEILKETLTAGGYEVHLSPMFRYQPTRKFDVNIFVERFNPKFFGLADHNCFIPNQEWFENSWMPFLHKFELFLCKSKFAQQVFSGLGCKTEYISFTSHDRFMPDVRKDEMHWIHVAGKSVQKQTEIVIRTWSKNSGFPQLTIVQDPKFYKPRTTVRNINFMCQRIADDTLRFLQNSAAVHVCPSETEGFGHYIMEGLNCKGVVITTNGAPMTELVTSERGFLVEPVRSEPLRLSQRFFVNENELEKAVARVLVCDDHKRREIGERARQFYLENDAFFRRRLPEAISTLFRDDKEPSTINADTAPLKGLLA